ncbi:hypothetical protein GOV12_01880 [Candidatus Pacearchaeota archaeon]|nr:hypothetical protein [Candidatus Pacearchaeota archaeon]
MSEQLTWEEQRNLEWENSGIVVLPGILPIECARRGIHSKNCKDIGLNKAVRKISKETPFTHSSITTSEDVYCFGMDFLTKPVVDPDVIKRRQEVVGYFIDNPDLVKLIHGAKLPELRTHFYDNRREDRFDSRVRESKRYLEFIHALDEGMPESKSEDVSRFRDGLRVLVDSKRVRDLESAILDIESPVKISFKVEFQYKGYEGKLDSRYYDVEGELDSGRKIDDTSHYGFGHREKLIKSYVLADRTIKNIREKIGIDVKKKQLEVEVDYRGNDNDDYKIYGTARFETTNWFKTLKQFWRFKKVKDSHVVVFEDISGQGCSIKGISNLFKLNEYNGTVCGVDGAYNAFKDSFTELRFLSSVASHFTGLEESRRDYCFPKIRRDGGNEISGLIDPNLIGNKNVSEIVCNDVSSNSLNNVFVITGPNNNGKTTYMNSIAINQLFFQGGLPVYASNARMSAVDRVLTHYIRPGDINVGESRYCHELTRLRKVFEYATRDSLVLMDEPCSGTSPEDGESEVKDVLDVISQIGCTTYIATHYHGLVDSCEDNPYSSNLYCHASHGNCENDDLTYTYQILPGSSKESNGKYLARKVGADKAGLMKILDERVKKGKLVLIGGDSFGGDE